MYQNLSLKACSWQSLKGWLQEEFCTLGPGLLDSYHWILEHGPPEQQYLWEPAVRHKDQLKTSDPETLRHYLESHFTPYRILSHQESGLFTGYFELECEGSLEKTETFTIPLYKRPADLILIEDLGVFHQELKGNRVAGRLEDGNLQPYFTRKEIDLGALAGLNLEIAWIKDPLDAFFMSVQGSGKINFANGSSITLTYDAANGWPYTSIGNYLVQTGKLEKNKVGMTEIYSWLQSHANEHHNVLWQNQSYIFFRTCKTEHQVGASGMQLIPERSLATDQAFIPFGSLLWVDIDHPTQQGDKWRKLMIAQDKGSAIKGPIRGDIYWGSGPQAAATAGHMKCAGTYFLLIPNET